MIKKFGLENVNRILMLFIAVIVFTNCPSEPTLKKEISNSSENTKPTALANQSNNSSVKENANNMHEDTKITNKKAWDDLQEAIDDWVAIEAGSYGTGESLERLWIRGGNTNQPFLNRGARRLIRKVKKQPTFKECDPARKLKVSMFGDKKIKTVGNLYDKLDGCGKA